MRFRRQDGASAVEFALVAPLLVILLFGIINFGVAFLQIQSIRAAVREGGRTAAVGASVTDIQRTTVAASSNAIPSDQASRVGVDVARGGYCNPNNIGDDVAVSYDTVNLPGGGIIVHIPLIPNIVMTPVISASFRCEV